MGQKKKSRKGPARPANLPDHIITAHDRQHSLLATSEETFKQHAARRGDPLIVNPQTVKRHGQRRFAVDELLDLRVDRSYQREEVKPSVGMLIHVLKRGGIFPDPITVAERKYGDHGLYIVDGQQRWWASIDVGKPIEAIIYHVSTYEDEVSLFQTLNMQRRLNARTRVASWPRAAGRILHWLNDDVKSPLYQRVSFGDGNMVTVGSVPLLRGMLALLSNTAYHGSVDTLLQSFDRNYEAKKTWSDHAILQYARIVGQVFHDAADHRLRPMPAMVLGKIAHAAWKGSPDANTMKLPNERQISRLRRTNWSKLIPNNSPSWMPTIMAHVNSIWPVGLSMASANGTEEDDTE